MKDDNNTLDEISLIATIRTVMVKLEQLAIQWNKNHAEQWQEYSNDIAAPKKVGRFSYLEENQARISQEYSTLECDVIKKISYYDAFCDQKGIQYSGTWNHLLLELRSYLSGPTVLSVSLALT